MIFRSHVCKSPHLLEVWLVTRLRSEVGGDRGAELSSSLSCSDTLMCSSVVASTPMVPAGCSSAGCCGIGGRRRRGDSAAAAHIAVAYYGSAGCGAQCSGWLTRLDQ